MLSLFPEILFLAPFAVVLTRIALATTLAISAWKHLSNESGDRAQILAVLEIIAALAIAAGVWTQAAGIAASFILIATLAFPRLRYHALGTTLLALVMALSLIVTGAGILSFDLPL